MKRLNVASSRIQKPKRNAYKCTNCRKGFATNVQLNVHQCGRSKNPKWVCRICCHTTGKMKWLIEHMTRHFTEEIQFRCPVSSCRKGFFYSSSLDQHIRTHYGYKCIEPRCTRRGKSFATRCSLENHVKKHLLILKFACDFCPNTCFANKSRLNAHKKTKKHAANMNRAQSQK